VFGGIFFLISIHFMHAYTSYLHGLDGSAMYYYVMPITLGVMVACFVNARLEGKAEAKQGH